jgi:hypothetical protein
MSDEQKTCECPICGRSHRHLGKPPNGLGALALRNEYDKTGRALELLIANGELSDYDDELANRVRDAIEIVRGVCRISGVPLQYNGR